MYHKLLHANDATDATDVLLIQHVNTTKNPSKTTVLAHHCSVRYKDVQCYKNLFTKVLQDIGESHNYIVYAKHCLISEKYHIKLKPKNSVYRNKIIEQARKTWGLAHRYNYDKINKNPSSYYVIIKQTDDLTLAEWYKSILKPAFEDYPVTVKLSITSKGTANYQVVVYCNIDININITSPYIN